MNNLRYLKFYSSIHGKSCIVKLPSGLKSFSNKLVHLHWENYPLKHLPSTFCPAKLAVLCLEDSQVKTLWDGVQDIVNLREVNLRGCKNLLELPAFCKAEKLKIVELSDCENLRNVHPSIISLHTLIILVLSGCKRLKSLQSESHLKSLANLYLDDCVSLKEFSLSSEKITDLDLKDTLVDRLHSSIGRLNKLTSLSLSSLKHFPVKEFCLLRSLETLSIYNGGQAVDEPNLQVLFDGLRSLKYLHLKRCSNLFTLPDNITNLLSLSELVLSGSNIESLPAGIKHLPNLKSIDVSNCKWLRSLPELPPCIVNFDANNCTSLETVATSTTLKHSGDVEDYRFFFQNCVNLDEHSLTRNLANLLRYRVDFNKCVVAEFCLPRRYIPMLYKQTRENCMTVDIAPPFDDFKGFLLGCVISQFITTEFYFKEPEPTYRLTCLYHQEDDPSIRDEAKWYSYWVIPRQKLDHLYIWYLPFHVKSTDTNSLKVSFEFMLTTITGDDFSELLKQCRVNPVYMTPYGALPKQRS